MANITPFTVKVAQAELDDLRSRLQRTRLAPEFGNDDWRYGTNGAYLKDFLHYWETSYDWRQHEAAINNLPNFMTRIESMPIHFIHVRGKGPKPVPLILSHGWPWTFWDWHKVIGPLSDPAAYGGDPADAFDVVVPSLPGYGYSNPLTTPGINFWRTADLWVKLMRDVLGYDKFAAGGGDWGAILTAQLGHRYAQHLIGIYLHLMVPLDVFTAPFPGAEVFAPEEAGMLKRNQRFFEGETGYSAMQATKPQTLAFALNDSPAGLAAWIIEKRRTWSDCGGDVERRFSKDDLATTLTIYWTTQSFGNSARYYYECAHNPWRPAHHRQPLVEAPTGIAVFPHEVVMLPRSWAERYYNLKHWTPMKSGGHFAPMEEPAALIEDIRVFYRTLR